MKIIIINKSKMLKVILILFAALITSALICGIIFAKDIATAIKGTSNLPIYKVETEEKLVAITFDSTWGEDNTKEILNVLKKYDAKATFFLLGRWIEEFKDDAIAIHKEGHEIGNHSYKHPDFTKITSDEILKEINKCDELIYSLTGKNSTLVRVPSGAYNDTSIKTIQKANKFCVQWDADSIDWKNDGVEIEYNRVMKKVGMGSIVLFHNGAKYTPKTLDRVLSKLKNQGYKFVTVSDLIYKENYIIDNTGKQIKVK